MNERLSEFAPKGTLEHEELPLSLRSNGDGTIIPHQLQVFLETIKKQYLTFMKEMQVSIRYLKTNGTLKKKY